MTYDAQRKAVRTDGGRWLHLTPIESALLERMLQDAGRLVTYKQLAVCVPGWDYLDESTIRHYLSIHVGRIHDKVGDDTLLAVRDHGYLFNPGIEHTCRECGRFM